MNLVDSHCHLDDLQFAADRDSVIERAHQAGIKFMLSIGTGDGPPDLTSALRTVENYSSVYATVGVHPNDASKVEANTFNHLRDLLGHQKVKAIGEIGLDYHWGVPKEVQLPVFLEQLSIARSTGMPVIIHTRDAWEDTIDVLRAEWTPTGLPCLMHCFTGSVDQARTCLDLGFHLAFGGVTTFPKSSEIREAARLVPLDRMLLETDAPYLAPVPFRGKRNEPAYVAHTARVIAELRGIPAEELAAETTETFKRLFGISEVPPGTLADQLN